MRPEDLDTLIDLLGAAALEDFKNEIRAEAVVETNVRLEKALVENEKLSKEIKAYRVSIAKLETHIRLVLLHYNIPLEKIVIAKEEAAGLAGPDSQEEAPVAPLAPVAPFSVPLPVSRVPPVSPEALISAATADEGQEMRSKIEAGLQTQARQRKGMTIEHILFYLEKVAKLPVNSLYWQAQGESGSSRIRRLIHNHLYKLKLKGWVGREKKFWYWSKM